MHVTDLKEYKKKEERKRRKKHIKMEWKEFGEGANSKEIQKKNKARQGKGKLKKKN